MIRDLDVWFKKIRETYASQMQCGKGCTACCHGLFDISLADAAEVANGFGKLSAETQASIRSRAMYLQREIAGGSPHGEPPTLFAEADVQIDEIVDAAKSPPCPCLGSSGECLIYEHRPLACRLEGVPMVDVRDGLFADWCELNFQQGVSESARTGLRQDYDAIEAFQEARSAQIAQRGGLSDARSVTFIPSVIAEYDSFWRRLLASSENH
jgi:Fe-S-cluster containining protein